MYHLIKNQLFKLDPEHAHERTISALQLAKKTGTTGLLRQMYGFSDKRLESEVLGIKFPNPVGLAAGFDKNAEVYRPLAALGFGFIEVGTMTPVAQPGNDKPRLFRLVDDKSIINRMGFNNHGAQTVAENLADYANAGVPIGVNIGKNKTTPNENAADDYEKCLDILYPYGHYFVINISSPNTPNLRDLQETESLVQLIKAIRNKAKDLEQKGASEKPILLKVAPDMTDEHMRDVVQVAVAEGISGIIATNTTLSRDGLISPVHTNEAGGLSGRILAARSTEWVREIYQEVGSKVPIIGVGGIFNGDDAYAKIRAGASLVQVYTGMIYEGPGIAKAINKRLVQLMERDGFTNISQVIGVDR
ncbi:quinone-dependent dihydroorotate dehydrogenase [Metabacillus fastidiosus]|uniref:Dihydroorotate dehydrogenase (quinone) n=1 Tax=Metabacillus fastidiosus TaxID=1458 RepID=A0ABU6NW84_9BACI|nr:quinone-dependent dihydroorotate dehydrogenase [Metabacillus fastidiosus]MED4401390.1 quinone-dependent dihydroorotate dehydrogenase [Metabacillus fastidiosus]MED4453044.1 quinone-dependent dihydroorotate dehydrogenase [Metabacillus fastidiosus]